ncbi:hypothetical protein [Oceanibaculum pacificum]|uniref:Motility protein n=1 Tax=Oceanibaculum pacificum TaxID=580166 RepID=A0A154VX13_9PROT|nr:hypothetical protein [Oceanibaculum pacificum]KZD05846.1 hypothetical protein AUP43_02745 [Oceanibaculum pacificum]
MAIGNVGGAQNLAIVGLQSERQQTQTLAQVVGNATEGAAQVARSNQETPPPAPQESGRGSLLDISV